VVQQVAANDFARQWMDVREDALDATERVGRSGWLIPGEEVEGFEREFVTLPRLTRTCCGAI
jgi:dTDP-4-amino-4,6-dideoxygalactose transaminase